MDPKSGKIRKKGRQATTAWTNAEQWQPEVDPYMCAKNDPVLGACDHVKAGVLWGRQGTTVFNPLATVSHFWTWAVAGLGVVAGAVRVFAEDGAGAAEQVFQQIAGAAGA